MAIEPVPLLRENSILCWEKEDTFKTAPSASAWQVLGRVEDWEDLGPVKQVFREAIAGSGREAATIGVAGTAYPPMALGPFQIVDPRFMGFAWGQEPNSPVSLGSGYYRHTAIPTTRGIFPSMSVQMADYKSGVMTDGLTFLGVVMPKLSARGEEVGEDGSGGRIMAIPTLVAHDDSSAVAAKTVSIPGTMPFFKQHAALKFYNDDLDWRIHSWEFDLDSHARTNWYHTNTNSGKPAETPPEGITYDIKFDIIADGHQNLVTGKMIRDLLRDEVKGNVQLKYIRTANQDEWAINVTDMQITSAPKRRSRGKNHYQVTGHGRSTTFEWVDQNSTRYFPQ